MMSYSFGRCDNRIEAPDFDPTYRAASHFGSTMSNPLKHAPWINRFLQSIPDSIARLLHPGLTEFIRQKEVRPLDACWQTADVSIDLLLIEHSETNLSDPLWHQ